mgnify:CR=1 FL=1
MLLFRISRFFGVAGGMAMRMCEARFGLTRREWGVMATLATEEGLLSSELAQKVQLDRARTSRALRIGALTSPSSTRRGRTKVSR